MENGSKQKKTQQHRGTLKKNFLEQKMIARKKITLKQLEAKKISKKTNKSDNNRALYTSFEEHHIAAVVPALPTAGK